MHRSTTANNRSVALSIGLGIQNLQLRKIKAFFSATTLTSRVACMIDLWNFISLHPCVFASLRLCAGHIAAYNFYTSPYLTLKHKNASSTQNNLPLGFRFLKVFAKGILLSIICLAMISIANKSSNLLLTAVLNSSLVLLRLAALN